MASKSNAPRSTTLRSTSHARRTVHRLVMCRKNLTDPRGYDVLMQLRQKADHEATCSAANDGGIWDLPGVDMSEFESESLSTFDAMLVCAHEQLSGSSTRSLPENGFTNVSPSNIEDYSHLKDILKVLKKRGNKKKLSYPLDC